MGNTVPIPTISHLPDQVSGWVANEFKEYNKQKKDVVHTYKTLDRLGKGGFGTVYKVQHSVTGQIYALKYIPSETFEPAKKEATIMMNINHPTIVTVHSFFPLYDPKSEKTIAFCIVMDFVEGQNLRDAMHNASESIPKSLVIEWFIKILEALNYLHEKKIYHRDIKPENVIIKMDGAKFDVILVDFGLAAQAISVGQNITVAGTFPYLSPDLMSSGGKAPLNGKADVWALGCILYEIWTQDSSFVVRPMGMAGKLISDPNYLDKLDDLSISQVLSYMLKPDPGERISAMELLNSELIKGWQAAIDPMHPDRNNCPRSAMALLPYLSIIKDKASPISHCLANLIFISRWQKIQDFQRVLIDFNLASTLIELMDYHATSSSPKSESLPLFGMSGKILTALISNVLGDLVAYQICSHPIGIKVLLRSNLFDVILRLLHVNFGLQTLKNHFALEHYIYELMFSGSDDQIRGAIVLFEDIPKSSIPLIVYLNTFAKFVKDPAKQVRNVTDLLYNHEDTAAMIQDTITYNKLKDLIAASIYSQSEFTERLLAALLRTILPRPLVQYGDCINHRLCTATITGTNKYYQYLWVCRTCNTSVCISCAKRCHATCKGDFISAVARCRCSGTKQNGCECVLAPASIEASINGSNAQLNQTYQAQMRGGVANFSFVPNKDLLLPAPHDGLQVGSLLRFWETTQELKVPPYSGNKVEPKHFFRNKGVLFTPSQGNALGTTFYYEVEVLAPAIGPNASIGVGLTVKEAPPKDSEMVGWTSGWAYHGDDGKRLCGKMKGLPYGPIFSTGDRIGCGVLSDGTVFFTLNGLYLGPFPPDEPKVSVQSRVFSTVSVTGYDAHLKFYFEPQTFLFSPAASFEPMAFFKNLPLLYCNLNLFRESFGNSNQKILDLLQKADPDLAATLLHALSIGNPSLGADLRHHPLHDKIASANSVYATTLVQLGTRDIYGDEIKNPKQRTARSNTLGQEHSLSNLRLIDKSDGEKETAITSMAGMRIGSVAFPNSPVVNGPQLGNSPFTNSAHVGMLQSGYNAIPQSGKYSPTSARSQANNPPTLSSTSALRGSPRDPSFDLPYYEPNINNNFNYNINNNINSYTNNNNHPNNTNQNSNSPHTQNPNSQNFGAQNSQNFYSQNYNYQTNANQSSNHLQNITSQTHASLQNYISSQNITKNGNTVVPPLPLPSNSPRSPLSSLSSPPSPFSSSSSTSSWGVEGSPRLSSSLSTFSPTLPSFSPKGPHNAPTSPLPSPFASPFASPFSPPSAMHFNGYSTPFFDPVVMDSFIKAVRAPAEFTTLHVAMAGGESDDLRELVLVTDQLNMKGMTAALIELFEDIFPEGRAITKIVKEVNSTTLVKLMSDRNIQALRQNDKIIVYFS